MVSLSVDFETIEGGKAFFKSSSELMVDLNYQGIIKSRITKSLLEEQLKFETRYELLGIIENKLFNEHTLTSLRQDTGKDGFENTEIFLQSNIVDLAQKNAGECRPCPYGNSSQSKGIA